MDLWRKWLPALVKAGGEKENQAVADLALLGMLGRPNPDAVAILIEFRFKALLALNKKDGADEILAAAKSYYNVCDFKATATAVTYVGQRRGRSAAGGFGDCAEVSGGAVGGECGGGRGRRCGDGTGGDTFDGEGG